MTALVLLLVAAFAAGPLVLVVAARRAVSGRADVSGLDRLDGVGRES